MPGDVVIVLVPGIMGSTSANYGTLVLWSPRILASPQRSSGRHEADHNPQNSGPKPKYKQRAYGLLQW